MLNSSLNKKLLLLTLLTSVATLTACGKKEAQPEPASSSSIAVKVSSKSSSLATTAASSASSTEVQVEEASAEANSEESVGEETAAEVEETAAPMTTSLDVNGLSAGDYRSIAGTWANAEGKVFTVTADGVLYFGEAFDENAHHKIEEAGLNSHGRVGGSLGYYHNGERAGGAHISIVPAGVANILDEVGYVDHIEIGHDVSSGYPEQQFFRQH